MNEVQKIIFDIYQQIADVCERHGLRYYVIDGTLLGAVRHKGFIPWDDDMDIGMPRPDYDAFMALAGDELPGHLKAIDYRTPGVERPLYFCEVVNLDTAVTRHIANEDDVLNVWVDIFPLDPMPSNAAACKVRKYQLLYQRMMVQFSNYDKLVHQHRASRPLHERALMRFHEVTKFGSGNDTVDLYAQMEKTATSCPYERAGRLANISSAYKFREMFPKSWYGEPIYLEFEGVKVPCPQEYHLILTQLYGDYLTPISVKERENQHCLEVVSLDRAKEKIESL